MIKRNSNEKNNGFLYLSLKQVALLPKIAKIIVISLFLFVILASVILASSQVTQLVNAHEIHRHTPSSNTQIQLSFAKIVEKTTPAVVDIYAKSKIHAKKKLKNTFGAGVIVRNDGIIVTNKHVVNNAKHITIITSDGRAFNAKIIYSDKNNDIAILAIKNPKKHFKSLKIANSDHALVGDIVLAIGNPFGAGKSVSSGIISSKQVSAKASKYHTRYLQTDATLNPGNSGGPLVNLNGEIVGINTGHIYSKKINFNGIGLAIPSNLVNTLLKAVYKGKTPQEPYFAAVFNEPTKNMSEKFKLPFNRRGVIIEELLEDSLLEKKGIRKGDIITQVDGVKIENIKHLNFRLFSLGIGHWADFQFYRKGKIFNTKIKLQTPKKNQNYKQKEVSVNNKTLFSGLTVANISSKTAALLKISNNAGVIITKVKPKSIADKVGFKVADVILEVFNNKITNQQDFLLINKYIEKNKKNKTFSAVIKRNNRKYIKKVHHKK